MFQTCFLKHSQARSGLLFLEILRNTFKIKRVFFAALKKKKFLIVLASKPSSSCFYII